MPERDDFPEAIKRSLAQRVSQRCSNPSCKAQTSGPQVDPTKSLNVGVAAHISAASEGGPRFDPALDPIARVGPGNGIWLCQTCAKLVDNDADRFPAEVLHAWKVLAEHDALLAIGKTSPSVPEIPKIIDKWVDIAYPENAGISQRLRSQGYKLYWSRADEEARRIDLEGWSIVEEKGNGGQLVRFKIRDPQCGYVILLKKPTSEYHE